MGNEFPVSSFGPFDPAHAWKLRERLVAWCETPDLGYVVGPVDVCEAIIPALDAMMDLYAWTDREPSPPTPLPTALGEGSEPAVR